VLSFAVTWDYRCPFARNAHEHIVAGLAGGADWDVRFVPFSLSQAHVEEGEVDIWDDPERDSGLLALQVGTLVRDWFPDRFPEVHASLFAIRHDDGKSLRDETLLRDVLERHRVDADAVFDEIATGKYLSAIKSEHTEAVERYRVWGVPTFIVDDQTAFVRLMNRPEGDTAVGRATVERVVDLLTWRDLNEFKHTSIPR
jgi:DSBA-like thioredoxin domain